MSFHLDFDWVDVAPSPDEFARRTMAKLCIRVNGTAVTSITDHRHRLNRDHVLVPLHHVAEWLVAHWHHLLHEVADTGEQRPDFDIRHNLVFAGDGFVMPQLTILSAAGATSLRWLASRPRFAELEFIHTGEARVPTEELEQAFRTLIDAVVDKLRRENLPLPALDDAWSAINELDAEEQEFARAAALIGVDPFDVDDALADSIVAFWQGTLPNLREDALAGADTESLPKVERWLRRGLSFLDEHRADGQSDWDRLRRSMSQSDSPVPWMQGYELARCFLREIGGRDSRDALASSGLPEIPHRMSDAPSTRLQGLVAADSPACVVTSRGESAKRFLRARALGAYLASSSSGPSLLSSLSTDFQALTRAFAAELLAPARELRDRLGGGPVGASALRALAREFRVSDSVIRHQIENHHLAPLIHA